MKRANNVRLFTNKSKYVYSAYMCFIENDNKTKLYSNICTNPPNYRHINQTYNVNMYLITDI